MSSHVESKMEISNTYFCSSFGIPNQHMFTGRNGKVLSLLAESRDKSDTPRSANNTKD